MVLKLLHEGSDCFFEGHYVQVTVVKREDVGFDLPRTFTAVDEGFQSAHEAHVIREGATDAVLFDCEGFLMEKGKTIQRYPRLRPDEAPRPTDPGQLP